MLTVKQIQINVCLALDYSYYCTGTCSPPPFYFKDKINHCTFLIDAFFCGIFGWLVSLIKTSQVEMEVS